MTGDQSCLHAATAIGTAGSELTAMRKEAGKLKKMIWPEAEGPGGKMTTPVTTDPAIEALAGPMTVTAGIRGAAETGTMIIKTTNGDQRLVDMTGISLKASGATEMKTMAAERAIATRETTVTVGHGALMLIDIEETTVDTARRAGTGKGGTEMIDSLMLHHLSVLPRPFFILQS
jgi:hypothetical protein